MINIEIKNTDSKYIVIIDLFETNKLCKVFNNINDALSFQEEFYLNVCLFLMYGIDDQKALIKYAKSTYQNQDDYEDYKSSLVGQLWSRNIKYNADNMLDINNSSYQVIDNPRDIKFIRNNINYRYLTLDRIRDILRKILLLKAKRQGGFNLTNLYWNGDICAKLCQYLFPELITDYKNQEEAIKKYTSYYYKLYNDLLSGYPIDIEKIDSNFIDAFFELLKCFKKTPLDLYLYRGAGNDQKYHQKDNEFIYNQFISTSLSISSIRPFGELNEQYNIMIPKGTKVLFNGPSIDREISIENEVILLPSKYTINQEHKNLKVLKYQEDIDPVNLFLDNLVLNKEAYINKIGIERYEQIYDYILKKAIELKKEELEKQKQKQSNNIELPSLIEELALLLNYYGVQNQKEDHNLSQYRL